MPPTPGIIEDLTEEEKYLWAILSDESGLDLAEFTWTDELQKDGIWRAWPYQWSWFRSKDPQQIDQCARSVGKSLSIKMRGFCFPFVNPGQEMVITAPELNHLEPITELIEHQFNSCRLGRFMLQGGRSGVTHRPFKMNFKNGAHIYGRIPQKDGKGVKGIHPMWLEMDEAQDYPEPGWIELFETVKQGFAVSSIWRAHGVTRGVRDKFHEYTTKGAQDGEWKVHRFTAMHRPVWSDEERQKKIALYHGREDPDYRRNVLGEHGDSTSPIFVLHRLMACTDDDQESAYNSDEYTHFEISDSWLEQANTTIEQELDLPAYHTDKYRTFWAGMDVGFTNHPSEIVVFAEERLTKQQYDYYKKTEVLGRRKSVPPLLELPRLKLVCRITLKRISTPDQKTAIEQVIAHYKPRAFSFDATGAGLPMFQDIQRNLESEEWSFVKTVVKGYNFSGNILVDFDQTIDVDDWATKEEVIKETGIKRNTVEYATDKLRYLVDNGRLWLPWDKDLLAEFEGQTYKVTKTALNQYGKREYCVDDQTEVLTADGWKTHDLLRENTDEILTLNTETGMSEFLPLDSVYRYEGSRSMLSMEGRGHSSLTTLDHRWFVNKKNSRTGELIPTWTDSRSLRAMMSVPKCAPCSSAPLLPSIPDALVEIIGWYWTEGWNNDGACCIGQSDTANPEKVKRIRTALTEWLGDPVKGNWTECPQKNGLVVFRVAKRRSSPILAVLGAEKSLLPSWLTTLTRKQLDLLIEVTAGYPSEETTFSQNSELRIRSFEMLCALAGRATKTSTTSGPGMFHTRILTSKNFAPYNQKRETIEHEGLVWCPSTSNGTFLARRNGTVYFTGNSLGKFHALDACRMMALGWAQYAIEEYVKKERQEPVLDLFLGV